MGDVCTLEGYNPIPFMWEEAGSEVTLKYILPILFYLSDGEEGEVTK